MKYTVKKSTYLFLTGILGSLLFLILAKLFVFSILSFETIGYSVFGIPSSRIEFVSAEYVFSLIVIMFGFWYGLWVGVDWYEKVYEHQTHGGVVSYVFLKFNSQNNKASNLYKKIENLKPIETQKTVVKVSNPEPLKVYVQPESVIQVKKPRTRKISKKI